MKFSAFDKKKIEEYTQRAREQWGETPQYKESEEKSKGRTAEAEQKVGEDFMQLFAEFGTLKDYDPKGEAAQNQVKKLKAYICEHFYNCTDDILFCLGQMYVGNIEFTDNIDKSGGKGTAAFVSDAISIYCGK